QTSVALELLIFRSTGKPVSLVIPGVTQADLSHTVEQFRRALIASSRVGSSRYLPTAQTLYQWLIKPIEEELGAEAIDTILFSMDSGLRTVPIAALHDGEQFLIEKYSVGMIPSLGLMDPHYQPLESAHVLAMGASSFESLQPLPAVPAEIETIHHLWPGNKFLNETFTQQNLINQQRQAPAQIIHLATHAEFKAGNAEDSYIQLWDKQLKLSDIHTLGWDRPTVDLLVLSACRTALGDTNAEMGFAGLAVAAGVKSALASLWTVSDVGTLALMSEFYHQLMVTPVKSDALRAAQLAMLSGKTRLQENELPISDSQLPAELRENLEYLDLSHPYYWAGFTLIGSPW
ncbi:MAG: CHAT domain-containing protein, partial [Cyanobacteria bacterium P01_F01_bin.116]